jgi:hypothetical protein
MQLPFLAASFGGEPPLDDAASKPLHGGHEEEHRDVAIRFRHPDGERSYRYRQCLVAENKAAAASCFGSRCVQALSIFSCSTEELDVDSGGY